MEPSEFEAYLFEISDGSALGQTPTQLHLRFVLAVKQVFLW